MIGNFNEKWNAISTKLYSQTEQNKEKTSTQQQPETEDAVFTEVG
jgi:hypothetical protein